MFIRFLCSASSKNERMDGMDECVYDISSECINSMVGLRLNNHMDFQARIQMH